MEAQMLLACGVWTCGAVVMQICQVAMFVFMRRCYFELVSAFINLSIRCCIFSCTHLCIVVVSLMYEFYCAEYLKWFMVYYSHFELSDVTSIFPIEMFGF